MKYFSTRSGGAGYDSAFVIKQGIAEDGGLFVPSELPQLSEVELAAV
jgi:threonine synthase